MTASASNKFKPSNDEMSFFSAPLRRYITRTETSALAVDVSIIQLVALLTDWHWMMPPVCGMVALVMVVTVVVVVVMVVMMMVVVMMNGDE